MPPIYISYRPVDAPTVEQIVRRCLQTYGQYSVIMNPQQSLPPDTRLETHVDNLIHASSTVLLIVGNEWAGIDQFGRFRLSTADVPIHSEISWALRSEKQVILVLIDGARMPPPDMIPDDLQGIYQLPAVVLRPDSFRHDLNALIHPPNLIEQLRYFFSLDWTQRHTRTDNDPL